jgi:hypothetical protein
MKLNPSHYNKMYDALKTIAKGYQTPEQLRRSSKDQFGLGYEECLEMAYENIQMLAKEATRNVRRFPKQPFPRKDKPIKTTNHNG